MALTTKFVTQVTSTLTDALDLSTVTDPLAYTQRTTLTSGTAANQADMLWHDRRTLAASATEDLDLAGVLVNGLGDTQTFARVKGFLVFAAAANTNNVQVTRPAANGVPLFIAAGDGVNVRPGGTLLIIAPDATGYAVTAATGDLLTFTNSGAGTTVTYDVVIIGASA